LSVVVSRPIGTQEADQLPFLNREADIADGMNIPVLAREETLDRSGQPVLLRDTKCLER